MTNLPTEAATTTGRSKAVQLAGLIVTAMLALATVAFIFGFLDAYGDTTDSGIGPRGLAVLTGAGLVFLLLAYLSWRLSAPWRGPGRSGFEQRYTRMWLLLLALGFPTGVLLGMASDGEPLALFSNDDLSSLFALSAAATLVILNLFAVLAYHRAIDDHEERAILWGNTAGYYFLLTALPAAWFLSRGGWFAEPLGLGTAIILMLASVLVGCLIGLWLKFR